jgi:ribonuclease HI
MSMRKVMKKILVGTWKMILKVFLKRKILGDISVEYLDSISRKNLKGITREISGRYFWKEFEGGHWGNICRIFGGGFWREYRPLYFIYWYQLANKHFETKFEIRSEFEKISRFEFLGCYKKLLYAVILTWRKLRHYFESHPVTVVSSFPLGEIIQCREALGRIAKWAVELMGEIISFAPRKAIKSQVLIDFLAEWVDTQLPTAPIQPELWTMYFGGSLMKTGAGAGLLFISPLGRHVRYVLRLHFSASNNVAEYEALVNGLRIVVELGVRRLDARGDSQLVIHQVMKNSHCHDRKMEAYCNEVRRLEDKFHGLELNHVARRYNETADELAKIALGRTTVPPDVFSRDIYQPSVKLDDAPEPEETSAQPVVPSATEGEALRIEGERNGVAPNQNWRTPYLQYLLRGELPLDKAEARRLARRAKSFVLLGDEKRVVPQQPLRHSPTMHIRRPRTRVVTSDTLGGLRSPCSTSDPRRKRFSTRFLLADRGGRRH